MRDMKFANWNTNQRSGKKEIPEVVSAEMVRLKPDAFVFTEFLNSSSEKSRGLIQKFVTGPLSNEYHFFYNVERVECAGENGILIAVKKKLEGKYDTTFIGKIEGMKTNRKEQPNFLQVDMVVNGKPLTIIGTRIRVTTDFTERREQLLALTDHIRSLETKNVIVAGDFNHGLIHGDESKFYYGKDGVRECYRQTVRFDQYAYQMMKGDFADIKMNVHTPSGEQKSFGFKLQRYPNDKDFKLDHLITTNGLKVVNPQYSHQFMENYQEGEEWALDGRSINSPFPDHAILTADISFVEENMQ